MAKQSTFGNMLVVLTVISVITGALLGYVYNITKEPIALSKKLKQETRAKAKEEKNGLVLAIEDYQAGHIHRAKDTADLMRQLME